MPRNVATLYVTLTVPDTRQTRRERIAGALRFRWFMLRQRTPFGALYLLVYAIASRTGAPWARCCCYCGTVAPSRWPWESRSAHLAECRGH